MWLLAALSGIAFAAMGSTVGIRLLRLSSRTRGLPEFLLGAGLCSLLFLTLPAIALGLGLRVGDTQLAATLYTFGLIPVVGFSVALFGFTTTIFRPDSPIAWGVSAFGSITTALGVAGTSTARLLAWEADRVVGFGWTALVLLAFVIALTWTGTEAFVHHRKLKRQRKLGLADPVVVNRVFLWSFGSLGAVAGILVVGLSLAFGLRFVSHPLPQFGIAFSGLSLSVCWWLAFLPPARYLSWLHSEPVSAATNHEI